MNNGIKQTKLLAELYADYEQLRHDITRNQQTTTETVKALKDIEGHVADQVTTMRRRLYQAVALIDHGQPDRARELLFNEAEALGDSWLGGDAQGSA